MKLNEFNRFVSNNPRPFMVDLWAPWCGPCRAMEPAFQKISEKYKGEVDVLKLNADDSPEVLRSLGVRGIPTVIGFAGGKEIVRRTGVQSVEALDILFDATLHQRKPVNLPVAPADRMFRSVAGIALIVIGWFTGHSLLIMGMGAVVLFSSFYDRCPIYKAVTSWVKNLFKKQKND